MKSLSIYIISIVAASLLLMDREATAQSVETIEIVQAIEQTVDCSNITHTDIHTEPVNTIVEEDYPYLRNLECLKNEDFLNQRGWDWKLRNVTTQNPSHFKLSGTGANINVQATYDAQGNLVESLLRIKDTRVPYSILKFIYSDDFEGWTMTGNEKVVKDFDPYQTEYYVTLSNGDDKQILTFKDEGNRILFAGVVN